MLSWLHEEYLSNTMRRLGLAIIDTYQNKIEASYKERSMLTDLFVENKFLGWLGLTIIFLCIGAFLWSFYPKNDQNQ